MAERDLNDPSVQGIINFSNRFLPKEDKDGAIITSLLSVGGSTLVYKALRAMDVNGFPSNEEVLLGIIAPDGEPFVSLIPLRTARRALVEVAEEKSLERTLQAIENRNSPDLEPS